MRKKLNLVILFISLIFLSFCKEEASINEPVIETPEIELNDSEKEIVTELNKFITLLKSTTPSLDNSDLTVFDQFADATVIGVGEATHGTKEFFQMKHRLFKYFVENHGFKIFGFEADMAECIYIDRFITKGIGTIDEVMRKMHFWTWRTEEVKNLILWMRDYNSGKSEAGQIHLIGVDCQFVNYNKPLIEEYLNTYDNNYPSYIKPILIQINNITYQQGSLIDAAQYETLQKKCDSVYTYFETNKSKLIANSGKFEYDIISRLIVQSKQFLDVVTKKSFNYRDLYMAENTLWLTTLLGNRTQVMSWAHNAHVAKNPAYSTGSQGYHLSQELGTNYKVIGFSFNQGSFQAVNYDTTTKQYTGLVQHNIEQLPLRESFNYIFHAASPKDFILIHSKVPASNPLYAWLNSSRKFMMVGAVYSSVLANNYYSNCTLKLAYDAVIHIQKTNSAVAYK